MKLTIILKIWRSLEKRQRNLVSAGLQNELDKHINGILRWSTFCSSLACNILKFLHYFLIIFPSSLSKSMNLFTSPAILSLVPNLSTVVGHFTLHPIFQSSTKVLLFGIWSNIIGKVSIGTPASRPSLVEFQPQCDQNPPTEGCHKTLIWSHQGTTK